MSTMREDSKRDWTSSGIREDLTLGCLQRIADAVEKMSGNYRALIEDREFYKRRYEGEHQRSKKLEHRNAGLRGAIKSKIRTIKESKELGDPASI